MRRRLSLSICAFILVAPNCYAGSLADRYNTFRDLHQKTAYWTLFFNHDAIRYTQSRSYKRFQLIVGDGEIDLPSQQGYCFVFNHYTDDPATVGKSRTYRAEIQKLFGSGSKTLEIVPRNFSPTDDNFSENLPDLCVSSLYGVTTMSIRFTIDDGNPSREISFRLK